MNNLSSCVLLILGIGFGVAEASLEHGATVIISSSNVKRIQDAVQQLQASYPSAHDRVSGHQCDIGDPETQEANLRQLLDKCGKLDHIAWTASDSLAIKSISEVDVDFIRKAGTTRFIGPIILGKLAPKYLSPGPTSSITFTTGSVSERPVPNWGVINSYATGLQGLTRGLALDLAPIRVNLVSPGGVDTPLWASVENKESLLKSIAAATTTGDIGHVEDVAESYIYLMKDKNISGSMVATNGGALLLGPR